MEHDRFYHIVLVYALATRLPNSVALLIVTSVTTTSVFCIHCFCCRGHTHIDPHILLICEIEVLDPFFLSFWREDFVDDHHTYLTVSVNVVFLSMTCPYETMTTQGENHAFEIYILLVKGRKQYGKNNMKRLQISPHTIIGTVFELISQHRPTSPRI